MKRKYTLALSGALVLAWLLWSGVFAVKPAPALAQVGVQQVGRVSTQADCVVVDGRRSGDTFAVVQLEWNDQVDEAFLVLSPAGSRAAHTIYINGQPVGPTPIQPNGRPCQTDFSQQIPIPANVLVKGENIILFTNDADPDNEWTAAAVRLEIRSKAGQLGAANLDGGDKAIIESAVLTSSFDGASHSIYYQEPDSYITPAPLVVVLHGLGGTGLGALYTELTTEANQRGWLLVAPNQHDKFQLSANPGDKGKKALAWVGAQHDIIDAVNFMLANYNVNKTRIYVIGGSMGGQTTSMMAAKYPDIFAAAVPWKPLTDLGEWHTELGDDANFAPNPDDPFLDRSGIEQQVGGTPATVPFEYARRSPRNMARNIRLLPFRLWHDSDDIFVKPHHSQDLKSAIDSFSPVTPVILNLVPSGAEDCPASVVDFRDFISGNGLPIYELEHCYNPTTPTDLDEMFNFLQSHPRNSAPPSTLNIQTDESKAFYWLNIVRPNNDTWSTVQASYSLANKSIIITGTNNINSLGFNLGSTPIAGPAGLNQAGLGLPATTYLVKKGGVSSLSNYAGTDYFNVALTPGQTSLTISAIGLQVSANPPSLLPGPTTSITITAVVKDQLNNPVPNATQIVFTTTHGIFQASGSATHITTISGGQGQAVTILKTNAPAQVTASVQNVNGTVSIFDASSPPTNSTFLPLIKK